MLVTFFGNTLSPLKFEGDGMLFLILITLCRCQSFWLIQQRNLLLFLIKLSILGIHDNLIDLVAFNDQIWKPKPEMVTTK
jgi:hypothetical protein